MKNWWGGEEREEKKYYQPTPLNYSLLFFLPPSKGAFLYLLQAFQNFINTTGHLQYRSSYQLRRDIWSEYLACTSQKIHLLRRLSPKEK